MNEEMKELFKDDFTEDEVVDIESMVEETAEGNLIDKIKSEGISTKVKAIGVAALCVGILALKKIKKGKAAAAPAIEDPATTNSTPNEVTVRVVVDNQTSAEEAE